MALASWWRDDALPSLPPIPELRAGVSDDAHLLAFLSNYALAEAQQRLTACHRPYVAWIGATPVAYAWVATRTAFVGELGIAIQIPKADRYLWDFATLPNWRGRGIYPRLLQTIVQRETKAAERCWIIAAPENRASLTGIYSAGFTSVARLSFQAIAQPGLIPIGAPERVRAAASLFGVPVLEMTSEALLSPCWRCVIAAQRSSTGDAACWPIGPQAFQGHSACTC